MLLPANLTAILAPGRASAVAIRFTAVGLGAGPGRRQLDDLHVDPFKGH